MTEIQIITTILLPIAGLWLASVEYRMRTVANRIAEMASRREITSEIVARQEPTKVIQQEIKEDIKRLEDKIDKLYDKLTQS